MFDFLPSPPTLKPHRMREIAERVGRDDFLLSRIPPPLQFPLKSIDQVLVCIEHNRLDDVTPLEWVITLQNKAEWDQQNFQRAHRAAELIWQASLSDPLLQSRLLWRAALSYDQQSNGLADSLLSVFAARPINWLSGIASLPQMILLALTSSDAEVQLARLVLQHLVPPEKMAVLAGLPPRLQVFNRLRAYLPEAFIALYVTPQTVSNKLKPLDQVEQFLLRDFERQPRDVAVEFAEKMLLRIPYERSLDFPLIYQRIVDRCAPKAKLTLWNDLSPPAQEALSHWLSVAHYRDFEKIADMIVALKDSPINLEDQTRLKSRRQFWANYQTRFLGLRILLPQKTYDAVKPHLKKLRTEDIGILKHDSLDNSEICIFELERGYIAEVFRGGSGETRYFPKTEVNTSALTHQSISLKDLRALENSEAHDHVYLWQYYAEQWLGKKGLKPDDKAKNTLGKRLPDKSKVNIRNSQLPDWQRKMKRLEAEARGEQLPDHFGSDAYVSSKANKAKPRDFSLKNSSVNHLDSVDDPTIKIEYHIGDQGPGGGTVFYVDNTGEHGLEAEDADCMPSSWFAAISNFNNPKNWRLPNKEELYQLYQQRDIVGGFVHNGYYWSSSEYDLENAWSLNFSSGDQSNDMKLYSARIRRIRGF